MRHLDLAYPGSAAAWVSNGPARSEFLFGLDLLVAPVVDMGKGNRVIDAGACG